MDQGDELHVQSTTVPDEAPDRVSDVTAQLQVEEDAPTATAAVLYLLDEVEDVPGQEELQTDLEERDVVEAINQGKRFFVAGDVKRDDETVGSP